MKRYIVTIILLIATVGLYAQLDTAYFKLEYTPTIKSFNKVNQAPDLNDTVTDHVKFNYYITPQRFEASFKPTPIKYNKVSPDIQEALFRNYLKVGFGYPITPLLDFSFHNLQTDSKHPNSFGVNVHHYSSWGPNIGKVLKPYAKFPTSDTRVHLNFKHFFKHQTLYSAINYNHEAARFYGFKPNPEIEYNKDSLKNNFHHLNATIGIASNYVLEDRKLKQDVRLDYDFLYTNWKDMENHIGLTSFFAYDARWAKITGSQLYRANINFDYYNDKWNSGITYNAFLFNPEVYAHFTIKEYHILVGVGGVVNHLRKTGGTAYPIVELQLGVIPNILNIYAGVNGDCKYNSLTDLLYENPFVEYDLRSNKFTTNYINIYGGVKGNLVKKLNYNLSARYSYSKNLPFFIIDTLCPEHNMFGVTYNDGNMLNVNLNIDYEILSNLRLVFDANYWLYVLKDKAIPWHKPMLEFRFDGRYTLKKKFIFDLNFALDFGRKGLGWSEETNSWEVVKMKPILDFGLGFEYLINDRFSAFATVSNLACQYYSKFYDFKAFGINALVGVKYCFGNESIRRVKGKR